MVPEPGRVERTLHRSIADQAWRVQTSIGLGTNRDFHRLGSAMPDGAAGDGELIRNAAVLTQTGWDARLLGASRTSQTSTPGSWGDYP